MQLYNVMSTMLQNVLYFSSFLIMRVALQEDEGQEGQEAMVVPCGGWVGQAGT